MKGLDTLEEYEAFINWFKNLQTTEKGRLLDELFYIYHIELDTLSPKRVKELNRQFIDSKAISKVGRPSISSKLNVEKIREDYRRLLSLRQVAKLHKVSYETIRKLIKMEVEKE